MENVKKIIKWGINVLTVLFVIIFGFGYVFISSMKGLPPSIYVSIVVGIILLAIAVINRTKKNMVKKLMICGVAFSAFGAICQYRYNYDQNIPKVKDDDYVIFNNYEPFSESYKGIKLDSSLKLTNDLPRLDGATALYPIYASFVQNVYPKAEYPYFQFNEVDCEDSLVVCSKTPNAYQRLIDGKTDIIFVAGPSQRQLEAAKMAGVEFEMTPIGKESFVFFVNAKNPVDTLTIEQVQKIYTGEITNWNQLGGKNESIKAFQRPDGSGSQSALVRLMDGQKLMNPLKEDIVLGMGGIIHQTANYKNYKNAIGYSFRFYSTELVKENKIKHLAINGIKPTRENILNGTYPITNDFYAVTLKGHTNSNIDIFIDWILSEQGQQIIDEVGYVSLKH